MNDEPRIERLIAMAERLTAMLEQDIAALKAGKPALIEVRLARGSETPPWSILHPNG